MDIGAPEGTPIYAAMDGTVDVVSLGGQEDGNGVLIDSGGGVKILYWHAANNTIRVKEGDVIAIRERSRQLAIVLEAVALTERDVPDYLEVDHNKMTATFVRTPALGDIPYAVQMEPNLVVEFYSR